MPIEHYIYFYFFENKFLIPYQIYNKNTFFISKYIGPLHLW